MRWSDWELGVILPHLLRPNPETPVLLSPKSLKPHKRKTPETIGTLPLCLVPWVDSLAQVVGSYDPGVPTVVGICYLAMLLLAPMFEVVAVGTLEIRLLFGWSCSAELAAGCRPSYCKGVMLRPAVIFRLRYQYFAAYMPRTCMLHNFLLVQAIGRIAGPPLVAQAQGRQLCFLY